MQLNRLRLRAIGQLRSVSTAAVLSFVLLVPSLVAAKAPAPAAPAHPTATASGCSASADLSGSIASDRRTGTVINHSTTCSYTVGLASYRMFDLILANQAIFDWTTAVVGPGQQATLVVELPLCRTQVDLFAGDVALSFRQSNYAGRLLAGRFTTGAFCVPQNCTLTQGYWKNHTSAWPIASMTLGSNSYSQSQLLAILQTPVRGNGLIDLSHQLIAAKLNLASGADVNSISAAIAGADALIGNLVVGQDSLPTSATSSLVQALDDFNSGFTGPGHCAS